ncbi:MAG: hypothetical protein K2W85_06425 [Phycisphaerales bacterium]|nr:hypothetical protein [Phycisphaerales bacterium]
MPDPRDILDLSALPASNAVSPQNVRNSASADLDAHDPHPGDASSGRPYLRLWFECAKQYTRAYRSPDGTAYVGRCPACGASTRFRVGSGGTSERFFRVSC